MAYVNLTRFDNKGLYLDPVIVKIFEVTNKLEPEPANLIELMIYRLWLNQSLKSAKAENLDATLSALLSGIHIDENALHERTAPPQFKAQYQEWQRDAEDVDDEIERLTVNNDEVRKIARGHLLARLGDVHHNKPPRNQRQFDNLIKHLYKMEADTIYNSAIHATRLFSPRQQFQVSVVTMVAWLSLIHI